MRRCGFGIALTLAILVPAPAFADSGLPPGVHVNPNGPASSQYRIPIPAARNETGGGGRSSPSGPPLFGAGIKPRGGLVASASASAGSPATPSGSPDPGGKSGEKGATPSQTSAAALAAAATRSAVASAGSDAWVPLIGGGALVLLVGGIAGLAALRRPARPR